MSNIVKHAQSVSLSQREQKNGHKAGVLWFTGLSGSGKSTLAMALQKELFDRDLMVTVLDGDNVRYGLNSDLGFEESDRVENLRRVSEVAKLLAESGMIVITSFISPYAKERERVRNIIAPIPFLEVHINASLEMVESRDPKGLYAKARQGEISNFTGLDAPYEIPTHADFTLDTEINSVDECVQKLMTELTKRTFI